MRDKNRFTTNSSINNPDPSSEFYISENDRIFGDNFATGEYYRRKQENEKKKEKYKLKQNQLMERERKRWEKLDYEYLKKENQNMMNKERNLVGRKNNPGMAFNPLNLQYDNSVQGEILKRRDEESKYRAWLRSVNIDKHANTGFNIINGEERKILEERLNKDIVPDLIQKNIDQINEMKNKVIFDYNNFYTKCNPSSPDLKGYRYDNKPASTPGMLNNNGGRYRTPIDLRDEPNLYNNGVAKSNILPRGNNNLNNYNNNFNDNNDFNNMNYRNNFSPPPRSPRNIPYEMNDINNNMNNNMRNNMRNNSVSNINLNNNNNYFNNNMNNQYNNGRNVTPNIGIIDLNNMDRNIPNEQNARNNNMYPDNNNTLNNNNFRNNNDNNLNNDFNMNQRNQFDNYQNINNNNGNNQTRTPNTINLRNNGNNMERNDFNYNGNGPNINNNNNGQQRDIDPLEYQGQIQENYGVNPYNPFSRPNSFN